MKELLVLIWSVLTLKDDREKTWFALGFIGTFIGLIIIGCLMK